MTSPQLNPNLWVKPLFIEDDGTEYEAPSVALLIGKVATARRTNGKQYQTAARDVVDQLCKRNPHMCTWPSRAVIPVNRPQSRGELNTRILDWVVAVAERFMQGKLRYAKSPKEVQRRIDICASCPRQKSWARTCSACRAEVARLEQELLAPTGPMATRTTSSETLEGCSALGEDPRVSVYLDEQARPDNSLPGNCWRKG